MTTNKKLIKSTGMISIAIFSSRVMGFVRDILFAGFFGTNIFAQAFVVAFRIPNMLRDMVGEGATNSAVVPILTEYRTKATPDEYWNVARIILNLVIVVVTILSVAGILFAPVLIRLIAPGFSDDPEKFRITVILTQILFPYLIILGLEAYCAGVLNSLNYFITPAFATVILNITMIISLVCLCPFMGIYGLVVGVLVGGVLQILLQVPQLKKRGFKFDRNFRLKHPVASRIGKLLGPRVVGTAVYHISVFVDTILASLGNIVGPGGVAALYYSSRLIQLPLALFGVSLATAVLPRMSEEFVANDMVKFKGTLQFSLKTVFTVMIPAAFGLMIISTPLIRILFERGEFTEYSTAITGSALLYYSLGVFAYAGTKILVNAYYAMGDTRTPVRTAMISLGTNIAFNLILMYPLKVGGLALATSISAFVNFLTLYFLLQKKIGDIGTRDLVRYLYKIAIATFAMGLVEAVMAMLFLSGDISGVEAFMRLGGIIIASGAVYLVAAWILKIDGVGSVLNMVASKFKKTKTA
ncbi:MAG TPA: murein biosynthesis integral membrane protein MurJ [Candidatus Omnitrophota bacterium]|nr:murein biosynthesis integral membrane protein MurJ [Candidatus Omnitrophota bacterium]